MQSTLLTDKKINDSSSSGLNSEKTLFVLPDNTNLSVPVDYTDTIEISGACGDAGRRENRIIVQVFEGENPATLPIIDNSIDDKCQDHISTSSLRSVAGVGRKCLFVSQGVGIIENDLTESQYPQCFNGRFNFHLKLGRIIRQNSQVNDQEESTNPVSNYLVRVKVRTQDTILSDSAFANIVISRTVNRPLFSVSTEVDSFVCSVSYNPPQFASMAYTLRAEWVGPAYLKATSGGVEFKNTLAASYSLYANDAALYAMKYPVFPLPNDGNNVDFFKHSGQPIDAGLKLMPGISYKYYMYAHDRNYDADYDQVFGAGVYETSPAAEATCALAPPQIQSANTVSEPTRKVCTLKAVNLNTTTTPTSYKYRVQWAFAESDPNWMSSNPTSNTVLTKLDCKDKNECVLTLVDLQADLASATTGVTYYFAVRQYLDGFDTTTGLPLGLNQQLDFGELVGSWSPPAMTGNSQQPYAHSCTF